MLAALVPATDLVTDGWYPTLNAPVGVTVGPVFTTDHNGYEAPSNALYVRVRAKAVSESGYTHWGYRLEGPAGHALGCTITRVREAEAAEEL